MMIIIGYKSPLHPAGFVNLMPAYLQKELR